MVRISELIATLARRLGVHESRIRKLLPLTNLGPVVLKATLTGTLSPRVTLTDLLDAATRLDWTDQERHLGLANPG